MTQNYEVGQEVAYTTSKTHFEAASIRFSTVSKVTKSGQVTIENGMRFTPDGKQRKTKNYQFPSCRLMNLKNAKKRIEDARNRRMKNKIVDDFLEALSNERSGHGNYLISDEVAEQIKNVTELLKTKV